MYDVVFSDAYGKAISKVTFQRLRGQGQILPRLLITLRFEAIGQGLWIFAPKIDARLVLKSEVLAIGSCSLDHPISSRSGSYRDVVLELLIQHGALRYVEDQLAGSRVDLTIEFSGVYYSCAGDPSGSYPKFPGDGWETQWIEGGTSQLRFQVARSDWFSEVIQPIGAEEVIFTEILIPKLSGDSALKKAYANLESAEKAFFQGDDPATFLHCRGAFDALPGAKKAIFSSVMNDRKRERLDALAKEVGAFLHSGRHVAEEGEQQGTFPVNHRDAALAIALTRLLVSYVSQLR